MIRNLTPHPVNLILDGHTITLPPDGTPPRVATTETPAGTVAVDGAEVPVVQVGTGDLEGLPDQQPGVWLLVSRMVAEAAPHRRDLVIPHGLVRDDVGRVVGCSALGQVPAVQVGDERSRAVLVSAVAAISAYQSEVRVPCAPLAAPMRRLAAM